MAWVKPVRLTNYKDTYEGKSATVFDRLLANHQGTYESFLPLQRAIKETSLQEDLREVIITFVSMKNGCEYCTKSHSEILKDLVNQTDILDWLSNYQHSDMSDEWKAVLTYADRLVAKPVQVTKEDVIRLKDLGFSEEEVVEINQTVAYTSYTNQLSIGLGL
ncbi:peroxidase-related enzyme [Halobacillus litoralis]|uniref:carboxymuconolactone decarboxylase family protein n=1 Tax=Halobacillus litoralis TaxID=45668 RepID=UPI001CD522D6|nr:peroxidase-related enzyme [Halobacillus litoralis]MCA0971174.1 peroxidase-related enzyme [Halobacillus litoralis]